MIQIIQSFSQSLSGMALFAAILAYFAAILVALSFHEFAHAFTAYKAGDNTPKAQGRITLNPFKHISGIGMLMFFIIGFGWAKPVEVNPAKFRNYKKDMTIVALAGIITNIVLAIISIAILGFMILWFGPASAISNNLHLFAYHFFYFSGIVNATLAVFNFLPVYPLDGFKFLEVWLKPENKFLNFLRMYGNIILILFLITPLFSIISGWLIGIIQIIGLAIPMLFL